ncbi:MAG TPA: aconitase/3-isopropylmalate dehydratase large subunit family protein [Terriglobales bacterium]|nr:aconitase/3-isopropylmalate dehydratase large subunit family protein [Terriglobales bacterium]
MAEKLIGSHTAKGSVTAGEVVIVRVDYTFSHDAAGPLLIQQLAQLKGTPDKNHTIFFIDHGVPSPTKELANDQATVRNYASVNGLILSDTGNGICHQVIAEDYASPGDLLVGTDSHSCTCGGLCAFGTGMGATDIAIAMKLRKTWLRVPESIKINVEGRLPRGVFAKDLILKTLSILGTDGATYESLEFDGPAIDELEVYGRLTLTNMAVEAGAKTALVKSDNRTKTYLKEFDREERWREIHADDDASYQSEIVINASELQPQIAFPGSPSNVKSISEARDVKVNEVYIGSCTNTRIEDMRIVAGIFKNREKAKGLKLIVTPSSRKLYIKLMQEGILETLIQAGAAVTPPGCGVCYGAVGGIPADNEVIFSTSNRNFTGRTGNPKAQTYLGSPATAAATAITGKITDPREYV